MQKENNRLIRFLQKENAHLKEEKQDLTEEVRALRRYINALHRLQKTVHQFTPEQETLSLLDETLDCAKELLDAQDSSLMLIDENTDELVFVLVHGNVQETLPGHRIDRQEGIAGWVADNREPAIVNDVNSDWRFLPEVDEQAGFTTESLVAVPLAARGEVIGVIEVLNKHSGEDFTENDANALSILATLAASALDYAASASSEAEE